ncbi:hypothetical protein [Aeoliella sp. SH292]|uniref:hypothetical protein n=1 Tax=Aeoliella sp. SH292 TaxID=3454464 RepID=UPI003F9E0CF5
MIAVGIDDTDMLDTPGTNQLARHLAVVLASDVLARRVLRHQLLQDPRVPCTRKNGCASILFEPLRPLTCVELADQITAIMLDWIPEGSDPGLCVIETANIPQSVVEWGLRAQRELLTQSAARDLAAEHNILLRGLAGTEDGVIGALAAVGLMTTQNDGRIVHLEGEPGTTLPGDLLDACGELTIDEIHSRGIGEVRNVLSDQPIKHGTVWVEKKLRPNFRSGRVVLYATHLEGDRFQATKVT